MTIHIEIAEAEFDLSKVDAEVQEVVHLLRRHGVPTFASCSGHGTGNPWIRSRPCDPEWLLKTLCSLGYDGFYIKEYRSGPMGPKVFFIEIEFWNPDCLNRNVTYYN